MGGQPSEPFEPTPPAQMPIRPLLRVIAIVMLGFLAGGMFPMIFAAEGGGWTLTVVDYRFTAVLGAVIGLIVAVIDYAWQRHSRGRSGTG